MTGVREGRARRLEGIEAVEATLHAGRQRGGLEGEGGHFLHIEAAVSAGDGETSRRKFDVDLCGLQVVGSNPAAFLDDFLRCAEECGATQAGDAGAAGSVAVVDHIGVALDIADLLEFEAEFFGQQLLENRLMALAVRMSAHEDGNVTFLVETDFAAFVEHAGRLLDCIGHPKATQFAFGLRLRTPGFEAGCVRHLQRPVHVPFELTAVVVIGQCGLIRERVGWNDVLAPQLDPVDSHLACRKVDDLLDRKRRFGAPRTAIGAGGRRVGEDAGDGGRDRGRRVDAGDTAEITEGGQGAKIIQIGTDTSTLFDTKPEERAVLIEGKFDRHMKIAGMLFENAVGTFIDPFNRPLELFGRPKNERQLRETAGTKSEGTTHVRADNPQFALRDVQNGLGHPGAQIVGKLIARMQCVAVFEAVVLADGGARFHGVDGDAGERDFNAADVVGICECRIGRGLISDIHTETDIVRAIIPNCSRGRRQGILNFHDRIELFVIDFYQIGGVACLRPRFRDNKGDVVADKGDLVFRERQSFRLVHR